MKHIRKFNEEIGGDPSTPGYLHGTKKIIKIITVQDLIDELNSVKDKTIPIMLYDLDSTERYEITDIDDNLTDCVDINFNLVN